MTRVFAKRRVCSNLFVVAFTELEWSDHIDHHDIIHCQ